MISTIKLFLTNIRTMVVAAFTAVIAAAMVYLYTLGARNERKLGRAQSLDDDAAANRRMNNADTGNGDPSDDLDWLRRRGDR